MVIYLVGDTHGVIDIAKMKNLQPCVTSSDYVIILGDFGLLWYAACNGWEQKLLDFYNSFACPILWLDGNHENFERIGALPTIQRFGGIVGKVSDNIFHLRRGEIYKIAGLTFFVMGGANSVDICSRTPYISWWPQESPSKAEYDYALNNLERVNYKVDYVLTHDAPYSFCAAYYRQVYETELIHFLEEINQRLDYKCWYFGHHHIDKVVSDKMIAVYQNIHTIKT